MVYLKYKCNPHKGCKSRTPCVWKLDSDHVGSMNLLINKMRCPLFTGERSDFVRVYPKKREKIPEPKVERQASRFEGII